MDHEKNRKLKLVLLISDLSIEWFIRRVYVGVFALVVLDKAMAVMPRIRKMVDTSEIFIMSLAMKIDFRRLACM